MCTLISSICQLLLLSVQADVSEFQVWDFLPVCWGYNDPSFWFEFALAMQMRVRFFYMFISYSLSSPECLFSLFFSNGLLVLSY